VAGQKEVVLIAGGVGSLGSSRNRPQRKVPRREVSNGGSCCDEKGGRSLLYRWMRRPGDVRRTKFSFRSARFPRLGKRKESNWASFGALLAPLESS